MISSVNVTKFAGSYEFGCFSEEILYNGKLLFLCSVLWNSLQTVRYYFKNELESLKNVLQNPYFQKHYQQPKNLLKTIKRVTKKNNSDNIYFTGSF